jgi:hypothetical protein
LEKLGEQAKHKILSDLSLKQNRLVPPEGITIKQEPFENFIRDCQPLFEQHCVKVGESSEQWREKNLPLMKFFDDNGLLQIMMARSNGRVFGYLMTIISPSLEDKTTVIGTHSTFYADPSFPGLGLKLQRAANQNLKLGGVDEVYMQAGIRGDGKRLGVIYERQGAEPIGQMYRLNLKGTT